MPSNFIKLKIPHLPAIFIIKSIIINLYKSPKYNFITHETPEKDCNVIRACDVKKDIFYVLNGKTCDKDGDCKKGVCKDKKCYVKWLDNQNLNPVSGICLCPEGKKNINIKTGADNYIKTCIKDSCAYEERGHVNEKDTKECICNEGLLRCPQDIPQTNDTVNIRNGCDQNPFCLKDPCKPGGKWNKKHKSCDCAPSYIKQATKNNPFGFECVNPCAGNGPCVDRGTCYYDTVKGEPLCKDCKKDKGWMQSDNGKCEKKCLKKDEFLGFSKDSNCCSGKSHYNFWDGNICN